MSLFSRVSRHRIAVYTVVFGQVVTLNPVPKSKMCDFICFTNQELPAVDGWEIRLVETVLPTDLPRSSRHPKALPHLYLPEYSKSLYVDSSVLLTADPLTLWAALMPTQTTVIGLFSHSFHSTLQQEFDAVEELGYEKSSIVKEQLEAHTFQHPEYLLKRPIWGGIIARRHLNENCRTAMEIWFVNICRFSRRDQLSLPLALCSLAENNVLILHDSIGESAFHKWPQGGFQKMADYSFSPDD